MPAKFPCRTSLGVNDTRNSLTASMDTIFAFGAAAGYTARGREVEALALVGAVDRDRV